MEDKCSQWEAVYHMTDMIANSNIEDSELTLAVLSTVLQAKKSFFKSKLSWGQLAWTN